MKKQNERRHNAQILVNYLRRIKEGETNKRLMAGELITYFTLLDYFNIPSSVSIKEEEMVAEKLQEVSDLAQEYEILNCS
ncbi:MAG: hypothetical protein ACE5F2_01470 [Candidatus Paceibacteria bacterium]